uniref:Uncharacterized protein LOC111115286 n=1 Tax=Crassostrea virginica TaxID=6565 RepID=A0A8B8C1Z3_CRAVI|nr:uncharacterized protein LOC111115286 [Crassostrea virginica]
MQRMISPFLCFQQNLLITTLFLRCLFGVFAFTNVAESYENVAFNKSTWLQRPFDNVNYSAVRAVDGRKSNLHMLGGECAVSLYGYDTTEWRVDLGDVLYIHHIVIQYATQNVDWGKHNAMTTFFLGFSLYISNKTNKDDGVLCFKDTIYTKATIPNPVNITCPYHGRYVIYYNNRTHPPYPDGYSKHAVLALCEVEVYGCSTDKYYGEGHCHPCPPNCHDRRCEKVDGTCLSCIAGYAGSMCNEECSPGKFGHECNESCGVCARGEPCHHTNGTCLTGCEDGFLGPKCIKVKESNTPIDQRERSFLFIGVLIAAGIMVFTGSVFIITSKRIRKMILNQS